MTAPEFARLLNARKIGREKWIARCPAHPDKHPSLTITEGRVCVLVKCQSHRCDLKDILAAVGVKNLLHDAKVDRPLLSLRKQLEVRERRLGLMDFLVAFMPEKRRYWLAAIDGTEQEIIWLRRKLHPDDRLPIRFRGARRHV